MHTQLQNQRQKYLFSRHQEYGTVFKEMREGLIRSFQDPYISIPIASKRALPLYIVHQNAKKCDESEKRHFLKRLKRMLDVSN